MGESYEPGGDDWSWIDDTDEFEPEEESND